MVFVSSDRSQEEFDRYFLEEMPWTALPYADRKKQQFLSEYMSVEGIPTLVFLDAHTGEVVNDDGRAAVSVDRFVEDYPFRPKPRVATRLSPSEAGVIRLACSQVSRIAVKEVDAGRMRAMCLPGFNKTCEDIRLMVDKAELEQNPIAPLHMETKANWRPYPNFQVIHRAQSVEPLAGKAYDSKDKELIDFVSLARRVKSFQEGRQAIKKCLVLCTQVARKDNAAQYFLRASLIQALMCEVLPLPAAPCGKYAEEGSYEDHTDDLIPDERVTKPVILDSVDSVIAMGMSREHAWCGLIHSEGEVNGALDYIFSSFETSTEAQWHTWLASVNLLDPVKKWHTQQAEDAKKAANENKTKSNDDDSKDNENNVNSTLLEGIPLPLDESDPIAADVTDIQTDQAKPAPKSGNSNDVKAVEVKDIKKRVETTAEREYRLCIWAHAEVIIPWYCLIFVYHSLAYLNNCNIQL